MREQQLRSDLGAIRIHRKVIASIAGIAAAEIEGVKRVGGDIKSWLLELIGHAQDNTSIRVEIDRHEDVKVDIPVVIAFGYHIPDVCGRVQENVRLALEKMTSASIKDININVRGIERG
jgi:uncharacterized alkaline shock family protein YloU